LQGETRGIDSKLVAFVAFFERYIIEQGLPLAPDLFFARTTVLPDFYRTVCPDSTQGIRYNNIIHNFLHFVLLREFSEATDNGQKVVSPAFCNPVPRMSTSAIPKLDESVHSPLP
ncbi:VPA1269 family protein, partial [Pseudomonas helleri]|uniref:VPA1269 family protein n=1 Tax=Pseudomonas helleri TaxID=1608996 RepID=UPI00225E1DE2